jgi:hypothetical protein
MGLNVIRRPYHEVSLLTGNSKRKHIENSVRILFSEIIAWGIDENDSSAVWELFSYVSMVCVHAVRRWPILTFCPVA